MRSNQPIFFSSERSPYWTNSDGAYVIWFSFGCFKVNGNASHCVAKFWAVRLNVEPMVAAEGCSSLQPTQTVISLPHFPHPSNLSQPFLPQLGDEKQWIYIQRAAILFSLLHRVPCFPLSPLLPCHWRMVNGLKRHSIGRCTPSRRGGLTFPGVGKRNSYRPQTSCPLNEHLIQFPDACNTKNRSGGWICVGWSVEWGWGRGGLWAGKSWWILDWFLNFSSLRRGGGRDETKRKNKHPICERTCAYMHTHTQTRPEKKLLNLTSWFTDCLFTCHFVYYADLLNDFMGFHLIYLTAPLFFFFFDWI